MGVLIYNPQKGRLETIDVEFTEKNTTWFAMGQDIKMITDVQGGLLIGQGGYNYPVLVYDISRSDVGYDRRKAKAIMKMCV